MYFSLMSPTKESLASERGDRQMKDTKGDIPGPCIARATDLDGVEASRSGAPDRGGSKND